MNDKKIIQYQRGLTLLAPTVYYTIFLKVLSLSSVQYRAHKLFAYTCPYRGRELEQNKDKERLIYAFSIDPSPHSIRFFKEISLESESTGTIPLPMGTALWK